MHNQQNEGNWLFSPNQTGEGLHQGKVDPQFDAQVERLLTKCRAKVELEFNGRNSVMVSFYEIGKASEQYQESTVRQAAAVLRGEGRDVAISELALYISGGAVLNTHLEWHHARVERFLNKCRRAMASEPHGTSVMVSFCEIDNQDEQYTDGAKQKSWPC